MNGALIIDKPEGMTSHDVVARVRTILATKRVGHTGTLDPFATGVLVLLIGQATRLAQFIDKDEKEYEAIVRFGFETDTGDRTGSRTTEVQSPNSISLTEIENVLGEFHGEMEQVPPMYSAKKVEGRKLYELARQGKEIERKAVLINVLELEILERSSVDSSTAPSSGEPSPTGSLLKKRLGLNPATTPNQDGEFSIAFRIVCSAGTYIRTLAEDIGRKIGVGAHLHELRRTRAGRYDLSQSTTLEELKRLDDVASALIPMEDIVSRLPAIVLPDQRIGKTRCGMSSRIEDAFPDGEHLRIMTERGELAAIGTFDETEKSVRPKIVLV